MEDRIRGRVHQIYLGEELTTKLTEESERLHVTIPSLIRQAVTEYLGRKVDDEK